MTLPAKVAATVGVVGGGSLAGCYFGGVFSGTPWISLKVDGGDSYSGKVGEKYSIYLLAVHGSVEHEEDFNKTKWEELYKRYENEKGESTEFGENKVDEPYSSKNESSKTKSLNKVCGEVYKKSVSDEVDFSSGSDNKHKLARDLLKYCSPLGQQPSTIAEDKYGSGFIGSDSSLKNLLASTEDSGNYYFWEAQEKWFLSETGIKDDAFFKTFFSGEKLKMGWSLRDICNKAYGSIGEESTSTVDKPKKDDVKKYCSFKEITSS